MVNTIYWRSFSYTSILYKMHASYHTKMTIHHDKCNAKCMKCIKKSYTYATKELPHTNSRNQANTKLPPPKRVKVGWSRGLVKILASWSCVGTWIKAIFCFSTLSLKKSHLTSMCLVLEWSIGFFATLMALVLSHWSGTWYTPHQSHSWCMWFKGAESKN
jgi:hypothetical protein